MPYVVSRFCTSLICPPTSNQARFWRGGARSEFDSINLLRHTAPEVLSASSVCWSAQSPAMGDVSQTSTALLTEHLQYTPLVSFIAAELPLPLLLTGSSHSLTTSSIPSTLSFIKPSLVSKMVLRRLRRLDLDSNRETKRLPLRLAMTPNIPMRIRKSKRAFIS